MDNLYEILGVDKNATQDDIKKAYREKAKQHHPDVNGNEEEFKKVNNAYSILSDNAQRLKYDNPANPNDFNVFSNDDAFFHHFGFGGGQAMRVNNMQVELDIDIEDAYKGAVSTFTYNRNKIDGSEIICSVCKGLGYIEQLIRTNGGVIQARSACRACAGEGKSYPIKQEQLTRTITIPAGIPERTAFTFKGDGHEYEPNKFGNMILVVNSVDKDGYSRDGQNLIKSQQVPFPKLILGGDLEIDVFGKKYKVAIKKGPEALQVLRLRGIGFKLQGNSGDLFVRIIPEIPIELNQTEKDLLVNLTKEEHFKL